MKKLNYLILILFASFLMVSCGDDDEDGDGNVSPDGSFDIGVTGNVQASISGNATYVIDDDRFRISLGQNPPDLVMNYLIDNGQTLIPTGTYSPVSGTFTGMPDDEIAVQYNDGFYLGESGTVTITSSEEGAVSGSIDVELEDVNGNIISVEGDFTAVPN